MVGNRLHLMTPFKMPSLQKKKRISCKSCEHLLISFHHILLNLFSAWVDIVLLINIIFILVDVISANLTWIDLVSHVALSREIITMVVARAKEKLYHNWHPSDVRAFLGLLLFFRFPIPFSSFNMRLVTCGGFGK